MSSAYPEHDKLEKVREQSQTIGEFLSWLTGEDGAVLARYPEPDGPGHTPPPKPTHEPHEQLLARYFGVDLKCLEREKLAMLEAMSEGAA